MSSTWVAQFSNKKDYNHFVQRMKEIAPNGENIIAPLVKEVKSNYRKRGAYVDLDYETYKSYDESGDPKGDKIPYVISFDIAIWDTVTKNFVQAIFLEMCKVYKFVEIGCDSVELSKQEDYVKEYKTLFSWDKLGIKIYKKELKANPEKRTKGQDDFWEKMDKSIKAMEPALKKAAKRFLHGDASDLILGEESD